MTLRSRPQEPLLTPEYMKEHGICCQVCYDQLGEEKTQKIQRGGKVKLTINANDLLTVLKLAKLSAQEEEHETIQRVARAALEAIDEAISGVAIEPVEC